MSDWLQRNLPWLQRAGERWGCVNAEPLRLRAWLAAPIVWDAYDGLRIEGAIQHAVVAIEAGVPSDVFADAPRDLSVDIPIPIADVEIGGRQIACASLAVAPPCAIETVRFLRKRARVEALGVASVMIGQGPYKSMQIPKATLTAPFVDFF
jgi:hypothetical protein